MCFSPHFVVQSKDHMDNPYKIPSIEDLLADADLGNKGAPPVEEARMENANFHEEEDEDANVDAMLDSLFEKEE
jgi:hypothetical protein